VSVRIFEGDALTVLRTLPDCSVQMCVTSPPYFGLRDYGVSGQLGLEKTPQLYVDAMVGVFSEVKRVLRDDGTLWLNIGDSYAGSGKGGNPEEGKQATNRGSQSIGVLYGKTGEIARQAAVTNVTRKTFDGIKAKDLIGIPWLLAFALRADGWYLRSDIIWHKPNPMPESVMDRPTKSHEYLFLLTKSPTYYYDADAIAEGTAKPESIGRVQASWGKKKAIGRAMGRSPSGNEATDADYIGSATRNKRSVWTVSTTPYREAHFATFPPDLIEPCILAGSAKGDTVLDPFGGAGTTGLVADRLGRDALLIELNPKYAEMARKRITDDGPLFGDVA
jgi:DNA modification methylase